MKKLLTIMVLALALCLLCGAALAANEEYLGVVDVAGYIALKGTSPKGFEIKELQYDTAALVKESAEYKNAPCGGECVLRVWGEEDPGTHIKKTAYVYVIKEHDSIKKSEALSTPATCTTAGKNIYVCSCGYQYTDTEVTAIDPTLVIDVPALGHLFKETIVPSTCTTKGTKSIECQRPGCGATIGDVEYLDYAPHDYVFKIIEEANCKFDGVIYKNCSVCGANYEITVEGKAEPRNYAPSSLAWWRMMTGNPEWDFHHFDNWSTKTAATCTAYEVQYRKCGVCTLEEERTNVAGGYADHKYVAEVPADGFKCTDATVKFECSVCHDIQNVAPDANLIASIKNGAGTVIASQVLPHKYVLDTDALKTWEATCIKDGQQTWVCDWCHKPEVEKVVPNGEALGHLWGEWEKKFDPDEEHGVYGHWQRKCTRTGCTEKEDYVAYEAPVETCDKVGKVHDWQIKSPAKIDCGVTYPTVIFYCTVCKIEKTEHDFVRDHKFDDENPIAVATEPTCIDKKATVEKCIYCGKIDIVYGDYGDHEYETVTEPADCGNAGKTTQTCKYCGDVIEEIIPATGEHSYEWEEFLSNDCLLDGKKVGTCSVCGDVIEEVIPAIGEHDLIEEYYAPTCLQVGKLILSCSRCSQMTIETIDKVECNYEFVEAESYPATCGQDGLDVFKCIWCGDRIENVLPATGEHTYLLDEENSYPATCVDDGLEIYFCPGCGDYYEVVLDATGEHDYQWVEEESWPATCAWGRDLYRCTVCGDEWEDWLEPVKEHENTYEVVIAEPNCTEWGQIAVKCYDCGDSWIVWVEPNGEHVVEIIPGYPATCAETGLSDGEFCSVCGEILVEQVELEKVAHDWVIDEDLGTAPTCTAGGVIVKTCSFCGISTKENVDKLGHDYDDGVVTTEPTYDEEGVKTFTCSRCGDTYTEAIEKLTPPAAFEIDEEKTKFNAEDNVLVGNATQVPGTEEAGEKYARVTFFMADGTYVVTLCAINDAGDFQAMTTGDVVYIAIQIIDNFSVRPAEYNAMGWIEFDPTQD